MTRDFTATYRQLRRLGWPPEAAYRRAKAMQARATARLGRGPQL
jgi:hypothetical protein